MPDQNSEERNNFIKSGGKLNEWITEDVQVSVVKPVVDEKTKRVSFEAGVETLKQKTYYSHSIPRKIICSDHFMLPLDPKKYIFKCRQCDYHYKANTLTHRYLPETGKIVLRKGGRVVV